MGRKPDGEVARTLPFQMRMTEDEKAEFQAAAARDGMDVSTWLRWLAQRRAKATAKKK